MKNKCTSKFQLCDQGFFECELEKGHLNDHKVNIRNQNQQKYSVQWEKDQYKDINIDKKWLFENTNIEKVVAEIIEKFEKIDGIEYKEEFNEPIYGAEYSISCIFQHNFNYIEEQDEFELEKELLNYFFEKINIDESKYNLNIVILLRGGVIPHVNKV